MNLYFESLLKEDRRKRTKWEVTNIKNFNTLKKRRLIFRLPNDARMVWFNTNDYNYSLGISIFFYPVREWNFMLGRTDGGYVGQEFKSMVELQSFLSNNIFKEKNLLLRLDTNIGLNIKSLV